MSALNAALDHLTFDSATEWKNLTFIPLRRPDENSSAPDYQILDEALKSKQSHITEISEGGSVPELKLVNEGALPVFLLDGEELLGAKQNRVLNLSVLAPAKQTLNVPVSCVEAGRWSRESAHFAAAPRAQYAEGRARKMETVACSMAASSGASHASNQSEVWSGISRKAANMRVASHTSAMSDIFEGHHDTIEDYTGAFSAKENQIGGVFAINGEVVGLELFDNAETFRKLLPKLLRSYALDAIEKQSAAQKSPPPEDALRSAQAMIDAIKSAEQARFAAVGLGEDVRLKAEGITGAALEYEDHLVHLSAFRTPARETDFDSDEPLMAGAGYATANWRR